MTQAVWSPRAWREVLAAGQRIAEDNPAAALALLEAVDRAATHIGEHPLIGRSRPEIAGPPFRFLTLVGFRYVIAYEADRSPPVIARFLHTARDLPRAFAEP